MSDALTLEAADDDLSPAQQGVESRVYLVLQEAGKARVVEIPEGGEVTFGRSSDATIVVDDARVSRLHARIRREAGVVTLEDLNSRNGTALNGDSIIGDARRVLSGDAIRVGGLEVVIAASMKSPPGRTRLPSDDRAELAPEGVVLADPQMAKVLQLARRVAKTPTTVLLVGETGVGKEIIAELIHQSSPRAAQPLVRLNCASLPENLLESELFGHEKGAFTGADRRKVGYLEAADGGTLFLDEIGELTPAIQVKLLRVLETKRFALLGGTEELAVDIRVVSATHRDLVAAVAAGQFRQDLYFRISTFTLTVPPLRERPTEILLMANLFGAEFARRADAPPPTLARDAAAILSAYRWPGNVRELRNAIEHAVVLAEDGTIRAANLPDAVLGRRPIGSVAPPGTSGAMPDQVADLERKSIEAALTAEGGNQTRAARRLGISRRALLYRLEKYAIRTKVPRS